MAALVGFGGNVKVGANAVALMDNWELNPSANMLEKTSFQESWKTKLAGLKDWSAKASGRYDFTDTNGQLALWNAFINGTTVAVSFLVDATHHLDGTAFVKSPPIKAGVDALIDVEFDLEGTGPLVYV